MRELEDLWGSAEAMLSLLIKRSKRANGVSNWKLNRRPPRRRAGMNHLAMMMDARFRGGHLGLLQKNDPFDRNDPIRWYTTFAYRVYFMQ